MGTNFGLVINGTIMQTTQKDSQFSQQHQGHQGPHKQSSGLKLRSNQHSNRNHNDLCNDQQSTPFSARRISTSKVNSRISELSPITLHTVITQAEEHGGDRSVETSIDQDTTVDIADSDEGCKPIGVGAIKKTSNTNQTGSGSRSGSQRSRPASQTTTQDTQKMVLSQ